MKMGREYIIQGHVQGVGFRFFTYQWMKKQPITGYVWNRDDGSVGVRAFAKEGVLKEFENWLEAGGPRGAKITFWSATSCEYESMTDFSIRHCE
ncbi:acylphosphatase [Proteus sp. G2669]|uniref:acylphosphatase n=1 Tax=unclassified Proteus (in: enterobacteria) TaxID=257482 RepID=UPI001411E965|nr:MULTISPECIES: acylphosphatase [unclassified Proteus (in: enterobacteria)]NBM54154.1 acylphosphatase [Proteus sp. G2669]UDN37362.1 acylphosphatase [Proteus sp. NMG38-2]